MTVAACGTSSTNWWCTPLYRVTRSISAVSVARRLKVPALLPVPPTSAFLCGDSFGMSAEAAWRETARTVSNVLHAWKSSSDVTEVQPGNRLVPYIFNKCW